MCHYYREATLMAVRGAKTDTGLEIKAEMLKKARTLVIRALSFTLLEVRGPLRPSF